ncbi:CAP domain-containing protein [Streptacidiphilus cavernicola]|uniref:CAP domain-containing protein n=1 Tax=Streptacidiphilus cavernicola TaxID=3342716 RepID=A0ABV6W417_9ACTN
MTAPHRSRSRGAAGQHRSRRKPRLRLALTGAAAFAVLGGGTAFACLGTGMPLHGGSPVADAARHGAYRLGSQKAGWLTSTASPRPTAAPSTSTASRRPAPARHTVKPAPTTQAPRPSSPAASAAPTTASGGSGGGSTADGAVQQVLALINKNRTAQGLAPYTLFSGLNTSAAAHNQVMASGCGLSHQCPGEAAFGDRETAAGVHWTSAGENIGEGGGVANTEAAIAASAVGLTQMMLDEKPPDDGHRKNILNSGYTRVGIAVYRDSSGTVWLTQDFAS